VRSPFAIEFPGDASALDAAGQAAIDRMVAELREHHVVFELRAAGGSTDDETLAAARRAAVIEALRTRGAPTSDASPDGVDPAPTSEVTLWLLQIR
jgi:hypothetical protein